MTFTGNVYVTGHSYNDETVFDYATVKYIQREGCLIDETFYEPGDTNPDNVCEICDPDESETEWTYNNGASCNDDIFCNGTDTCQDGTCSQHTGDPCEPDEECNEETNACDPIVDDDDDTTDDDTTDDDTTDDDTVDDDTTDDDTTDDDTIDDDTSDDDEVDDDVSDDDAADDDSAGDDDEDSSGDDDGGGGGGGSGGCFG